MHIWSCIKNKFISMITISVISLLCFSFIFSWHAHIISELENLPLLMLKYYLSFLHFAPILIRTSSLTALFWLRRNSNSWVRWAKEQRPLGVTVKSIIRKIIRKNFLISQLSEKYVNCLTKKFQILFLHQSLHLQS